MNAEHHSFGCPVHYDRLEACTCGASAAKDLNERTHSFVTADQPEITVDEVDHAWEAHKVAESGRQQQCMTKSPHPWHYNSDNSMCNGFATPKVEADEVDHPAHYGGDTPYEVIKVVEAWEDMFGLSFRVSQVIKYLTRAGRKPGVSDKTDLLKAKWYLEREIAKRYPEE